MTDNKKLFLIRDKLGNYPLDQIEPLQRQGYDVVELTPSDLELLKTTLVGIYIEKQETLDLRQALLKKLEALK